MKSWCDSRPAGRGAWGLLALALLLPAGARAAPSAEEGLRCLSQEDLACAQRIRDALLPSADQDPHAGVLAARTAFHEGRYQEALTRMESARAALGSADGFQEELAHMGATVEATADFVEVREGPVVVRYSPGPDAVLVDEAMEVMEAARAALEPVLGGLPEHPALVEIYPTAHRFIQASGLGQEAVETTGVVALSKWSRLLMTSPRALGLGYTWKDTVVHEYIHQVVAWRTRDQAPVWLQEGMARHLESWWRGERDRPLGPYPQSLLAQALARNDLVTFEEMHPSMAFLPSAERATLAFAQVQMFVRFALLKGRDGTVNRTLGSVRDGEDAREALAGAAGYSTFSAFEADALVYLSQLDLVKRKLADMPPVVQSREDEFEVDPVLRKRKDLAGYARLGDLLRAAGHPKAALVEYGRATPVDEPPSPLLSNRVALCHRDLGDGATALKVLEASVRDYPEFGPTWKQVGDLLQAQGQPARALQAYREAADINPFDPTLQASLATLYRSRGDEALAARHERYRRILASGGVE